MKLATDTAKGRQSPREFEAERKAAVINAVAEAAGPMPEGWDWDEAAREADAARAKEAAARRARSSGFREFSRRARSKGGRAAMRASSPWLPSP